VTATIIRGDALHLPIADQTVDLICTSPPYFSLRSYTDDGQHYPGQLGSEPSPAEYVDALIAATREMIRVLKPSGSIWVNLGDKYAGQSGTGDVEFAGQGARDGNRRSRPAAIDGIRGKSLMGIPWRYALACIDQLGLILRAEIIWNKPNGLPESVTDRVRRSHEQWFHMVKQPRYYSAVDEIREEHSQHFIRYAPTGMGGTMTARDQSRNDVAALSQSMNINPLGKLPGSVWTIPTEPLQVPPQLGVDHFAAYPTEWPRRIIQGWTPAGICLECGEGRRPVAEVSETYRSARADSMADRISAGWATDSGKKWGFENRAIQGGKIRPDHIITGYVCACPPGRTGPSAPTRPSTVLDPFGGTGTTALVADVLGRHGISVDLSADYCRLARWRTQDPAQRARAARVDKPPPVIDGQLDLLGGAL
jgi:DNA modification methylase